MRRTLPHVCRWWVSTASLVMCHVLGVAAQSPSAESQLDHDVAIPQEIQRNVRVIWGESEYLLVGDGPEGVFATRVDKEGVALDEPPLRVDRRGQVRSIAFDGTSYFVVYVDDPTEIGQGSILYGRRVATEPDGLRLLDHSPIRIANAEFPVSGWIYEASVSFGAGYYLVAWSRVYDGNWDVATIRVSVDGVVMGSTASVNSPGKREETPRTEFDGSRFLLIWTTGTSIDGTFVEPQTGALGDTIQVSRPWIEPPANWYRWAPLVCWNGSHYMVAWTEGPHDLLRVVATGFTADGELLEGELLGLPVSNLPWTTAALTTDGSEFVLSWNEGGFYCTFDPCPLPMFNMRAVRIGRDGELRVARPTELGRGILATQATERGGRSLFVYQLEEGFRMGIGRSFSRSRPVRR